MTEDKTTLSLENQYGKYTIEANKIDMTIDDLFEDLIIPVLLASGFHKETIDYYLDKQ